MIPAVVDCTAEQLERLTDSFSGRPNTEGIVTSLGASLQALETCLFDFYSKRRLDTSTRDSLDKLGALVGQTRDGLPDADYREAIRLRIAINKSDGRAVDIVAIANALFEQVALTDGKYSEGDEASFRIEGYNMTAVATVIRMLSEARPAGVYALLTYSTWAASENLMWGSTTTTTGQNVLGSTYGSVTGAGKLVSSQVIP